MVPTSMNCKKQECKCNINQVQDVQVIAIASHIMLIIKYLMHFLRCINDKLMQIRS